MGRWTQYDGDEYRLPEGMKRIGYDSDSGRYYFRDNDGSIWKGEEGVEFGEMTKVSQLPASLSQSSSSEDLEAAPGPARSDGYQPLMTDSSDTMAFKSNVNAGAYRTLFPFFLIIAVILLLIWRLVLSPGLSTPKTRCPEDTSPYYVQPGDSCWEISKKFNCPFEHFKELNPKIECDPLMPGTSVCLPQLP